MTQIVIVGEAWGAEEEKHKFPFIGQAGQELTRMLFDAGINRYVCVSCGPQRNVTQSQSEFWICRQCQRPQPHSNSTLFITNTFNFRPPNNSIPALCGGRKEMPKGYKHPAIKSGRYVRPDFLPELDRLATELRQHNPNLIIAAGGTATWALLNDARISRLRGFITECKLVSGLKVLPVLHPAYILRVWSDRATTILDLEKAKREAEFPDIRRPVRQVFVPETINDLWFFYEDYIHFTKMLSIDIETKPNIGATVIGIAPSAEIALTVPFFDERAPGGNYWPTLADELEAWRFVQACLDHPSQKLGQNFLYDMQFLWAVHGLSVRNVAHDTMLLHHSLQPELEKGLEFLSSIYCNDANHKLLRPRAHDTEMSKRDE